MYWSVKMEEEKRKTSRKMKGSLFLFLLSYFVFLKTILIQKGVKEREEAQAANSSSSSFFSSSSIEKLYGGGGRGATGRDLLLRPWTWPRGEEEDERKREAATRVASHALLTSSQSSPSLLLLFLLPHPLRRKGEQWVVSELPPLFLSTS